MKRCVTFVLILLLSVLLLSACKPKAQDAEKKTFPPLVVGVLPDVDSVPFVIADMQGFYKEAGLDVRLEHFTSPVNRDAALQAGQIDGAISDLLAAAFALEGGFPVYVTQGTDGSYKLAVSSTSGIQAIKDLPGKTVAISKNTIIEYTLDRMLEENSIPEDKVEKVAIPQIPVRLQMLKEGKVDAAVLPEPLASSAAKDGLAIVGSSNELSINPGVMLFSKASYETKRDAIERLAVPYNRAVDYLAETDRSVYMKELITRASFPEDVIDSIVLPSYSHSRPVDESEVLAVSSWLLERSLVKRAYSLKDFLP